MGRKTKQLTTLKSALVGAITFKFSVFPDGAIYRDLGYFCRPNATKNWSSRQVANWAIFRASARSGRDFQRWTVIVHIRGLAAPEFSPPPHTFVICRRIVGWFALARRTVGTFCRATKAQSNPWRLVPKFSNGQGELNAPHTMGKYGKYLKKYSSTWEKEASLKG